MRIGHIRSVVVITCYIHLDRCGIRTHDHMYGTERRKNNWTIPIKMCGNLIKMCGNFWHWCENIPIPQKLKTFKVPMERNFRYSDFCFSWKNSQRDRINLSYLFSFSRYIKYSNKTSVYSEFTYLKDCVIYR